MTILQFQSFASSISPEFWQQLSKLKLDKLQLSTEQISVHATYSVGQQAKMIDDQQVGGIARLVFDQVDPTDTHETGHFLVSGWLYNANTMNEFRQVDRVKLFDQLRIQMWHDIVSGAVEIDPRLFNRVLMTTFANIKQHRYHYWCAYPVFSVDPPSRLLQNECASEVYSPAEWRELKSEYEHFSTEHSEEAAYFILGRNRMTGKLCIRTLRQWDDLYGSDAQDQVTIGFLDPSGLKDHPGWPLRNLLTWLAVRHPVEAPEGSSERVVRVLCYREPRDMKQPDDVEVKSASRVLTVTVPYKIDAASELKAVGWERDAKGKMASRVADISSLMDPTVLAETAVNLNLRLMRWRLAPEINLDLISSTRCLLVGAGTLGCSVSRTLLGWGVRNITLLDYGKVSYSNPARQALFEFDDCLNGGKDKAACAAEHLQRIFPKVQAQGFTLSVPMPGHPVTSETKDHVAQLEQHIQNHDVIFLLTDSRESRWLPTLLGASHNKIVINAAMGFDSFVVMRHGIHDTQPSGEKVGCYYCNDVVAPMDSMSDRTLDQQCTVTRPGLSAIASALAVELLITLLHHPLQASAPADTQTSAVPLEPQSMLGYVPHQIRGFMREWKQVLISGRSYDKCTACSSTIIDAYRKDGYSFIASALKDPMLLERMVGLDVLKQQSELVDIDWDDDD